MSLPKELALIFLTTRISRPWACTLNTRSFSLMSIFMFYEHNPNSAGSSQLLLANGGVVTPSASALHLHLWGWCIIVWHVMFWSALVNMMLHVVKPSDQVMSPFVIVKNLWAIILILSHFFQSCSPSVLPQSRTLFKICDFWSNVAEGITWLRLWQSKCGKYCSN